MLKGLTCTDAPSVYSAFFALVLTVLTGCAAHAKPVPGCPFHILLVKPYQGYLWHDDGLIRLCFLRHNCFSLVIKSSGPFVKGGIASPRATEHGLGSALKAYPVSPA